MKIIRSALIAAALAVLPLAPALAEETAVLAVIQVKVKNPEIFMQYVAGHMPSVAQYGGEFVLEAKTVEPLSAPELQGTSDTQLFIIQKWPSRDAFFAWWNSPEYKPWNELRPKGADVTLTLSEELGH